jgi:hypothetical protein
MFELLYYYGIHTSALKTPGSGAEGMCVVRDRHDITEILLKVVLNTKTLTPSEDIVGLCLYLSIPSITI